jgi:hypothetical protein
MKRAMNLAGAGLVAVSLFANVLRFWLLEARQFPGDDFRFYYSMARVGLRYGWSRIYDLTLQCQPISTIQENTDHCPALALPPVAWLAAPFTALPYPSAYVVWMTMLGLAFAAVLALAWKRLPEPRALYVAAALSPFPLAYCLFLGQVTILAVLGVALAWRLIATGHPNWAGVALILTVAKPQTVLLVPVALALAGMWRPVIVCAAGGALLGLASLASIGAHGVGAYLEIARIELGWELNYVYTLAGVLGRGPLTTGLQAVLALTALATAWRLRRHLDAVVVAGILGSALFSPYWHLQDYVVLILAAMIQLSLGPRIPATILAAGVLLVGSPLLVGATFVPAIVQVGSWLALEIAWLVWLASRPERSLERDASPEAVPAVARVAPVP